MSTFSYQTPVQFWWKWILYKLTLVSQSGWPLPRVPLNQGGPPCSPPAWPPGPRQGWATGSDRFWLPELRVSRHFQTFYGSSVQSMDTQLDALPTLPVLARGVSGCVNSAFLDISRHFTAHLFSPGIPSSARGKGGGPLAPLSGNPIGEVACWYESSHNPEVWSLADLLSDEHGTCSTPSWWHRILTTPSSEWEGR